LADTALPTETPAGPTAAPTATELTRSEAIAAIKVDMIFD
jgi:hypothetical protein